MKQPNRNTGARTPDWRDQLKAYKNEMRENMTQQERQAEARERAEKQKRKQEFNKRRSFLYEFLAGYKQNSGIYINNFFRQRDYETYCKDKFHGFDFDISGINPCFFDNPAFSWEMVGYLRKLEERKIAYFPITVEYIKHLICFSECMDLLEPIEYDTVLYRGCSTIERNGVNGIVSTTTDFKIAEQFSRGTIITLHVPKGTKCINTKAIRPYEQQKKDKENELLLPPCEYKIINSEVRNRARTEPNNHTGKTTHLEIEVKPLDLLEEFLKIMKNAPEEYRQNVAKYQQGAYKEAIHYLQSYINSRQKHREDENEA